jgi:hypothetical protein
MQRAHREPHARLFPRTQVLAALRRRFYTQTCHVNYDELLHDPSREIGRVLRFLGLKDAHSAAATALEYAATLKMSSARLSESVANARELERALEASRWRLPDGW